MALLKQATARDRVVFMVDSTDHVSGKTGLTLTITASKNGGSFASISPTVTELANGWYKLALTSSHTDTLGDFALHVTGTGADPTDLVDEVVVDLPGTSTGASAALTATVADSVPSDGTRPSVAQAAYMLTQFMLERVVSGTTVSVKKVDGTTTLFTLSLNDPLSPTGVTRAT